MNWNDAETNPPKEGQLVIAFNGFGQMMVGFAKQQVDESDEDNEPDKLYWIVESPDCSSLTEKEKSKLPYSITTDILCSWWIDAELLNQEGIKAHLNKYPKYIGEIPLLKLKNK